MDERLSVALIDGEAFLYVNRDAALVLARAFAQLALGAYTNGFHVHVHRDVDADKAVELTLVLEPHRSV